MVREDLSYSLQLLFYSDVSCTTYYLFGRESGLLSCGGVVDDTGIKLLILSNLCLTGCSCVLGAGCMCAFFKLTFMIWHFLPSLYHHVLIWRVLVVTGHSIGLL